MRGNDIWPVAQSVLHPDERGVWSASYLIGLVYHTPPTRNEGGLGMADSSRALGRLLLGGLIAGCGFLAGCVGPQSYRVTSQGGELWIETPYSFRESQNSVSLAYFSSQPVASCPLYARAGTLTARWANVMRAGHSAAALLFNGPEATVKDEKQLLAALDAWWGDTHTAAFRACHRLDQASVRRSLLAQRPQSASGLLKSQFALDYPPEGQEKNRGITLLLRPGMRLCANDVASNGRKDTEWRVGGASCARVVRAPEGGAIFDPVFGRFNGLGHNVHHKETVQVSSWSEIERPCYVSSGGNACARAHTWMLIYPEEIPGHFEDPSRTPSQDRWPILAGIAMSEGEFPEVLREFLKPGSLTHADRLEAFCHDDRVVCYRFGVRAAFTVDFVVFVNGAPFDVAVGSTVGDIAATIAPDLFSTELIAPASAADPSAHERAMVNISRLKMSRVFDGYVVPVDFSNAGVDAYKMPLQPGDRLIW